MYNVLREPSNDGLAKWWALRIALSMKWLIIIIIIIIIIVTKIYIAHYRIAPIALIVSVRSSE